MDDLNLSHIRVAKHLFIDGTWYKPGNFSQILIIEYKDIILNEKYQEHILLLIIKNINYIMRF